MEVALAADRFALGMTGCDDMLPSSWPGPACHGPCLLSKLCTQSWPGLPMPQVPPEPMQASGLKLASCSGLSISKRQHFMDVVKQEISKFQEFQIHTDSIAQLVSASCRGDVLGCVHWRKARCMH